MEIIEKKIVFKLDKEERDNLVNATALIEEMRSKVDCDECPFKQRCDKVSKDMCLLYELSRDLKYINNNCE
jgi:hypothetical protein